MFNSGVSIRNLYEESSVDESDDEYFSSAESEIDEDENDIDLKADDLFNCSCYDSDSSDLSESSEVER